ncbi:YlbL family protein [Nocardioides jiangxiensis]|uniref:S16 family serine protease n=1 Tax=Nocardioides jiangxiensis TaxID=3064524 RepID=A0ABT9AXX4_9ACTN|nr:S16 family serine protease [Nocardioides sp. WY-20]MDO7867416.1 S16 family serine protease [Nocardioides sp. WY-20]
MSEVVADPGDEARVHHRDYPLAPQRMSRHTVATLVAAAVTAVGAVVMATVPMPYVRFQPGTTVDLLSATRGTERIQVEGHRSYPDDGELRMTTIMATPPKTGISLIAAVTAWLSADQAVKPDEDVYGAQDTAVSQERQSAVQMSTSQDVAIAAAMVHLGIKVPRVPVVGPISPGYPADGALVERDRYVRIGGHAIHAWSDVVRTISHATPDKPLEFVVERDGKRLTVPVTPRVVDGRTVIGVQEAFDYEFPFKVTINLPGDIGGPSAGLMFALSVVDTLTPGSLTGGARIAGTGEMLNPEGIVGPIGGIQQKIAGARQAGASLFLVPAANCDEAVTAHPGSMRLAAVATLNDAEKTVSTYAADHRAKLPTCEEVLQHDRAQ